MTDRRATELDHPTSEQRVLRSRLLRTKAALLAASLTLAGVLLIALNGWLDPLHLGPWSWLHLLPIGELGGTLFGAGLLGSLFEYSFRRDQEESAVERFRAIIKEQAPAMRDAVINGFAIHPEDLKRVANPQLLDDIATNVMALRLGDHQFAQEIYGDLRDQIIGAAERWYDVEIKVRVSRARKPGTPGAQLLDVTVEAEYTTTPTSQIRRFACVADRVEYDELRGDIPATTAWLLSPRPGVDARSRSSFELLQFTLNGQSRTIRRREQKHGQTYAVDLGADGVGRPVRIRHIHRTVTPTWGHRLFIELPQPARGVSVTLDYTDSDLDRVAVTDLISALHSPVVTRSPADLPGKTIMIEAAGWLLPKAGFAFTWTLHDELPQSERSEAAA